MDELKKDVLETSEDTKETTETYEELKAKAEEAEAELKKIKEVSKEEELKENMKIRLEKAQNKLSELEKAQTKPEEQKEDLDVRNLITLDRSGIEEGSEKEQVLKKYLDAGLIKSYAEGLKDVAVLAKFAEIDENLAAKTVVLDNFSDDETMRTKKEILLDYKNKGEVPTDPTLRKVIVEDNLKKMGF